MPLTDTAIKNAKPADKDYKLTDEKGMYLLVCRSGGKLFRYNYRYLGKRKTLALGSYPDVSLAKAREGKVPFCMGRSTYVRFSMHLANIYAPTIRSGRYLIVVTL